MNREGIKMELKQRTKTIHEIVQEYLNRHKSPEHESIGVRDDVANNWTFNNVTNIQHTRDEYGLWLEFDSNHNGKKQHIKMKGYILRYFTNIKE